MRDGIDPKKGTMKERFTFFAVAVRLVDSRNRNNLANQLGNVASHSSAAI